jgi:HSP20 family protein
MSMLTRWNPFKTSGSLASVPDFEDMFRGFGIRPLFREMEPSPEMRLDVTEDDLNYHVSADIPGVKKEDIAVSVDGNIVSIGAELRRGNEVAEHGQLCSERYYGRVQRSFTLPIEVDQAKSEAHYDDGVLHLTLGKKPNGHARRIMVS